MTELSNHYIVQLKLIQCFSQGEVDAHSVMSDSLRPHRLQSARLLFPWGFSRQEYWSGLPCPPPGNLPNPGIKPRSSALPVDSLLTGPPREAHVSYTSIKNSDLKQMYYLKLHIRSLISHWAKIKVSAGLHYFEALKWEPNPCLFCLSSAILTSFNDFNQPVAQNWDLWVRLPEHYHSLHSSQFPLLIECRVTFYSTDQIVSVTCFKYINDFSHNWNKSQIPSVTYKAFLLLCPHVAILSPGSQSSIALIFFFFFYLQTF